MKKLATVSTLSLILVACSSATSYSNDFATAPTQLKTQAAPSFFDTIIAEKIRLTELERQQAAAMAEIAKQQKIRQAQFANQKAIEKRIKEIRKYNNRTWYVFSGSTPRGWDCSGLVVWFYEGLGKKLPHSASKQGWIKPKNTDPRPGDIVVFRNKGYKNYNHSAIYLGNNKIIHAGFQKGDRTEIISLDNLVFKDVEIKYIRILEVPLD